MNELNHFNFYDRIKAQKNFSCLYPVTRKTSIDRQFEV